MNDGTHFARGPRRVWAPTARTVAAIIATASLTLPVAAFGSSSSTNTQKALAYSSCMRSHGVPNFPDPDANGTLTLTVSPSLDPSSPLFQAAEADCQHLLPARHPLSQARQQHMKQRLLAVAACMRSHGFPHYPDPTFGSGGMVSQGFGRSDGIDPNSPIFQAAQKTCQGKRAAS